AKEDEFKYLNQLLSDISLSTSAAPTLLPAYDDFQSGDNYEFNMIDGGAAAGNPVLVALSELAQEKTKHPELYPMMESADDCSNILLLSLGCGNLLATDAPGWTADTVNGWSLNGWLADTTASTPRLPFYEILGGGSLYVLDYYAYSLFQAHNAESNYLRVQTDALTPEMSKMDNADPENLKNLEKCANEMIQGNAKRLNPVTFQMESMDGSTTYAQELRRFAKILSDERKNRLTL
ncbi:hypothetical protein PIB30_008325, partial [Stylosanthes scabra]|nr:hypothetical protein [Stylosanthes scabra]